MARRAAVLVLLALVALPWASPGVASAEQLALSSSAFLGLRARAVTGTTARADLASGLSKLLAGAVGDAQLQVSAAAGHGVSVRSEAFVFGDPGTGARVLAAWVGEHRASRVALGQTAGQWTRRFAHAAVAAVAWREGDVIGLIVVDAGRTSAAARALEYARLEDSNLRIPLPATAWDRVLAQVRPDGMVSKQTALEAFALEYGSVPGVHPPGGPRGVALSGDVAQDWILPYLSRLTRRQQRIVDDRLGFQTGARRVADAACAVCDYGDLTFMQNAKLQAIADKWEADYAAQLGPLGMSLVVGTADQPATEALALADAAPLNNALGSTRTGPPSICRVRMFPIGLSQSALGQGWTLAHEVFHCFEFRILGAGAWSNRPKDWVMEGLASWAAFAVDPVDFTVAVSKLLQYVGVPERARARSGTRSGQASCACLRATPTGT
jgi:hypothetical protein